MRSRLCGAFAALALIIGPCTSAAADDATTGRINQGSAEIAKPPASTSGSMPNAIDDPARNQPNITAVTSSGGATDGLQNAGIGNAAANAPPGASPQTTPSTLSPENAAADHRSWVDRMLPLTDEQAQALRSAVQGEQGGAAASSDPRVAQAQIANILPSSVEMQALPAAVLQSVPQARSFKYVRDGARLLIVQPESWTVVGVL